MACGNEKKFLVWVKSSRIRSMLFRAVFTGLTMLCIYMGLRQRPAPQIFPHFDLLLHFGIFLSLALACLFAFPRRTGFLLLPLLVFFGFAIEVIQEFFISGRNGSWDDLIANTLGVIVGATIGALFLHKKFQKLYSRQ